MIQDLAGGVSEPAVEIAEWALNGQSNRLSRVPGARTCGVKPRSCSQTRLNGLESWAYNYRYCRQSGLDRQRSTVRYRDIEREIDLIEEIARLYGYNNFCDTLPAKTEGGS